MSGSTGEHTAVHEQGMTKVKIWQIFFYLLAITAVEFFIALYLIPKGFLEHGTGNYMYILLTLVKAFYIVAYFMHLKFEAFVLRVIILTSFLFIVYFIILMLTEGSYMHVHMSHQ